MDIIPQLKSTIEKHRKDDDEHNGKRYRKDPHQSGEEERRSVFEVRIARLGWSTGSVVSSSGRTLVFC